MKEMTGCHHQCNAHELGQTLGDGKGQGGLKCCSTWGHKELDMTEQLNNNNIKLNLKQTIVVYHKDEPQKNKYTFSLYNTTFWHTYHLLYYFTSA